MQLICVSRGSYSVGKGFAESLARKLGCTCLSREDLVERATEAGVAAGKLEMACLKPRGLDERMLLEREHFHAFVTAYLAERALAGPLVYHGRTGHLLLQGISHVLRLRVVADLETRIKSVEQRLGLDRPRAQRYIEQLEDDRRKWVKTFFNVEWDVSEGYDFIINTEHSSVENVAAAFCTVAQLPEFRETPASHRNLEDLLLASRCRVALARDDRTYFANFKVRAERGVVSVSYLPRHAKVAPFIPEVLQGVSGVLQILCTMASTRILWIQERFDPAAETVQHITQLADKWDGAVELMRLEATEGPTVIEREVGGGDELLPPPREAAGGIEEDHPAGASGDRSAEDADMAELFELLVRYGRAGGRSTVVGGASEVLSAIDRTTSYSLLVVGDVFLSKGKAASVRMTRELSNTLAERLRVPVIQPGEMKEQYLFGSRQLVSLVIYLAITAVFFFLVFRYQVPIIQFLTREGTGWRILAATAVGLFVPLVAYFYGNAAQYLLRLIKIQ